MIPPVEGLANARSLMESPVGPLWVYRLGWIAEQGLGDPSRLPVTVKILLENVLRRVAGGEPREHELVALAAWPWAAPASISFMPARVLMQDFTGVPAVVDLAALRDAAAGAGADPGSVEPVIPADLVVDHSIQVDRFGTAGALAFNQEREYERNAERYALLKWATGAFRGLRVVPPGKGICHQINLEHLARVVRVRDGVAFPDTVLGTDSHTTMVNGLGVLGWGVGGIEAEAALLGIPAVVPWPKVLGVRLVGGLPAGATATDLVLTLTDILRRRGVVGSFVEFFGPGLSALPVPDRATLSNMCPEYGATAALFPIDSLTLRYLRDTGRGSSAGLVERYTREQGMFRVDDGAEPLFPDRIELDLGEIEPSMAGPSRPQDRVPLAAVPDSFLRAFPAAGSNGHRDTVSDRSVSDGSVVISAITSCTNTSNPSVMVAAGLLAKKAVEAGLHASPWVKTSLAPGSRVVVEYLNRAGLMPYLERLGFDVVGYGCTTCIGNSGPLPDDVESAVLDDDLSVVAVLSGNRNFEGRIHPLVRASYLASPPLCVAYAIAGRIDVDLAHDPLGRTREGRPVLLRDLWPSPDEVASVMAGAVDPQEFDDAYATVFSGDPRWEALPAPEGPLFAWDPASTFIRRPPFLDGAHEEPGDIEGGRILLVLGDSVTTDHISPAGTIDPDSPAGRYLQGLGVSPDEFNSYGARRGNHEVMARGTFANRRLRNAMMGGREGPWTVHLPAGEVMSVYDAAVRYRQEGVPLVVVAGREYGSGSSRDWAAKGTSLLGVRAVLAESFERIHRSNLVGMGVLPAQFREGDSAAALGLTGRESLAIRWPPGGVALRAVLSVEARREDGPAVRFDAVARLDDQEEVTTYRGGGILPAVMEGILAGTSANAGRLVRREEP